MERNPIIVALDVPTAKRALELSAALAPHVGALKIGLELFIAAGPDIVREMKARGARVFLDLKLHDIPNTVSRAVASALELGVDMLTIHTSGGEEMMAAAEAAAQKVPAGKTPPLVLGVTILTSLDSNAIAEVGYQPNVGRQVERMAALAQRAGLRGLVCSALEVAALRRTLPAEFQLVTPGIRMDDSAPDDQKRTLTPREALAAGANWLVIGRPIHAAPDPAAAAKAILASL